ncbi:hypothetical protein SAMN04490243_1576 [Robiginitalea myxolifaciens]|uniref:Uncharacterized protein n=1 Tax=Robiginitalea myxolifaciens TaxID=400055 RepID=A0A1I6GCC6_9FLAO|nr:hypothetical protein [Robiginitalea myxolifaciens]SFR39864.1 hypothetical protein SAMN04490243_1576 [Robiginitalea myxolifaciens]
MYTDYKYVQECLKRIETQLGWGDAASWHNDVFIELSERIHQETQVLLSPTTLKRIWGRINYKSAPSISTLNALAQFAGFQNWREFKTSQPEEKPSRFRKIIDEKVGVIMLSAAFMTIVFISLFSLSDPERPAIDPDRIEFTSQPITGDLPNSVVFNLDLDGIESGDVVIQQSWDETRTVRLEPGQTQATAQYYYPGYFRSKLRIDGSIIKEHDLFIKSDGWLGTLDYSPIPKYFSEAEVVRGGLRLPEDALQELMSREDPLVSAFHYVNDFGPVSGDDFVLETSIRNIYHEKWAVCQRVNLLILGSRSAIIIPFSIPGCISEIGVMMSEVYLGGKENDLSGLGIDFSESRDIRIEVTDKYIQVFAEDTLLYSGSYTQSIGRIAGFRYRFVGAGEVSKLKLMDSGGKVVLDHNFN